MKKPLSIKYLLLAALLSANWLACDSSGSGEEPDEFDRRGMLFNIGATIILPAYEELEVTANALASAAEAFEMFPDTTSLAFLQDFLKTTRLTWQKANLFQFGPAETVGLRGLLNTYPADTDQINANIGSGNYTLGTIENLAAGGFPALDYLLHGENISSEEVVASFTTAPDAASRMQYVKDNIDFIVQHVGSVRDQWDETSGNYFATFLSDEKAGVAVGSSFGELVNALVLHLERFARDGKIGIPAGVRSAGVPRPRATEAFYGGYSAELLQVNLETMDRVFNGVNGFGDGVGLAEALEFAGATDLSNAISSAFDDNISAVNGLSDPLSALIESDLDQVLAVFTEMQDLVVLLKVDLTSQLGITITFQDNDGD